VSARRGATKGRSGRAGSRRVSPSKTPRRRRRRPGARRRQSTVLGALTLMALSLLVSVRRTAEGRRLAESINELREEEQVLLNRMSYELVRVDSLSSRERILAVAPPLGLRPATDREVLHLPDVGP